MSKNNRWMPLDVGDYLADTSHLTTLQHGAYMLILMHYWKKGPPPDDDDQLAAIARVDAKTWKGMRVVIRQFFTPGDGTLHQKRADAERAKTADINGKRSRAGKEGAEARWGAPGGGEPPDKPNGKPSGKSHSKSDGRPIAIATENHGNRIANAKQEPSICHDFASTPVPSPRDYNLSEEKEAAPARVGRCASAVVLDIAKSLKTKREPFTPSRDFQLAALQTTRELKGPVDPVRSVEEQLAILRGAAA